MPDVRELAQTGAVAPWHQDLVAPAAAICGIVVGSALAGRRDREGRRDAAAAADATRLRAVAEDAVIALQQSQDGSHQLLSAYLELEGARQGYEAAQHPAATIERRAEASLALEAATASFSEAVDAAEQLRTAAQRVLDRMRLHLPPDHPMFTAFHNAVVCLGGIIVAVARASSMRGIDDGYVGGQRAYAIRLRDGSDGRRDLFAAAVRDASLTPAPQAPRWRRAARGLAWLPPASWRLLRGDSFRLRMWIARQLNKNDPPAFDSRDETVREAR